MSARSMLALAIGALLALGVGCDRGGGEEGRELIEYSRSGGIAGVEETLEVAADGSASLERVSSEDPATVRFEIEPARLDALLDVIGELDFDSLDTGRSEGCFDCFVYELSHAGETITADDVTAEPALRTALARLDEIVRSHDPG